MSSLHQDRLLAEGQAPAPGSRRTRDAASGTSSRSTATAQKQTPGTVPTQRRSKPAPATSGTPKATSIGRHAAPVLVVAQPPSEGIAPSPEVVEDVVAEVVADVVAGDRLRFLRRLPVSSSPRRALYLAAALVGALSLGTVSSDPVAHADTETVSHSVSVAERLGIAAAAPTETISEDVAAARLGELVVSRNSRDAERNAAVQAQDEADRIAAEAAAEAARPTAVMPIDGARLTSTFGARWGTLHAGIDLAAPMLTPEYAVMDGIVLEAGPASGYGNAVYIQHENGDVTVYGHMEQILVSAGQVVRAGDTIALLGNRGQSTGPHLHFEVHVGGLNGQKIDPLPWLRERGLSI